MLFMFRYSYQIGHELPDGTVVWSTGGFYNGNDSHGECGVPAETYFYVPTENRSKFWYAADHGMFRCCVGDTEHDWRPGSEQHAFLDRCFASADRKHQPWLVFAAHRPLGYSSNDYYATEGSFSEPMGRTLQGTASTSPSTATSTTTSAPAPCTRTRAWTATRTREASRAPWAGRSTSWPARAAPGCGTSPRGRGRSGAWSGTRASST